MPYPNLEGKHEHEAFITPADFIQFMREHGGLAEVEAPDGVILSFGDSLRDWAEREVDAQPPIGLGLQVIPSSLGRVAIRSNMGIGAPVAVTVLEELAALGVRNFIAIGTAGTLQVSSQPGDLVLCTRAIRDEGVSHHYVGPGKYSEPSSELTGLLRTALSDMGQAFSEGTTWTIDAPYRETVKEARHYRDEGALTVEMEAAALFAVGSLRNIRVASAFVVSDSLAGDVWVPRFGAPEVKAGAAHLFRAALSTLLLPATET